MTQRKKVLIVVNEMLLGGAQRIILDIARGVDRGEFEIVIAALKSARAFSAKAPPSLESDAEAAGARIVFLSDERRSAFRELVRLVRLMRAERPLVAHTFLPYAGVIGRIAAWMAWVPNIASTQCNVPVAYSPKEYWLDRITLPLARAWSAAAEAIELQYAGSVAYISGALWRKGRRHFTIVAGIDVERIQRAGRAIDRDKKRAEVGIGPGDIMLFMTARLISWKGHPDLIRALASLPERVHACFAGWGPLEEGFRRIAREAGVESRVHFLGARKDVYELLGAADIFVQPFGRDAKGNMWMGPNTSQMEACAAGVPSVSTKVPLIEYLLEDGVTGTLAEVNDPASLARAIRWVIDHPGEARERALRAQARAQERYSVARMVRNYELLYRSMLGR